MHENNILREITQKYTVYQKIIKEQVHHLYIFCHKVFAQYSLRMRMRIIF